jgi:serine/threonine protein kinase
MALNIPGYEIDGLIARGGMAAVYLARLADHQHPHRNRQFAIKVFEPDSPDIKASENFIAEINLLSQLHHINIASIYEWGGLENGSLYVTMEYLEGGSLQQRISLQIGEIQALGMLIELAHILQFVHNHGIIHCDVKPANILFRRDDSMVLTDFGIAKRFEQLTHQKRLKTFAGSPDYCSPEQACGKPLDPRTDIYNAGLIFIRMLTGKNPYTGQSERETLINQVTMDIPVLNDHLEKYQPLVNRMLAKNRNDRFDSMNQCIDYIDNILKVSPMPPRPVFEDFPELPILTDSLEDKRKQADDWMDDMRA